MPSSFADALAAFAASLTASFASVVAAQSEDQLKAPVKALLENALSRDVLARSEAQVAGLGGRPDFGVAVNGLLAGYIELKAPGFGARPQRWTVELTRELLELLWVLEATVALWPEVALKLDEVVSGTTFTAGELPEPKALERKAPEREGGLQGTLF